MQTPQSNKPAATSATPKSKRPLWPKLLTAVVLLGVLAIAVSILPRGFSQDISLIGKGNNIVVLFKDSFSVTGQEYMDAMSAIRDEYDGRVTFIVADENVAQGKKFTELYGVDSVALVFFAPDGVRVNTFYGAQDKESLRKMINREFHF